MDRLTTSYKSLIADCKQRHSAEQEAALATVAELRERQGSVVNHVREVAQLQQAHDAAVSQVCVCVCVCVLCDNGGGGSPSHNRTFQ